MSTNGEPRCARMNSHASGKKRVVVVEYSQFLNSAAMTVAKDIIYSTYEEKYIQ